jgi:Tn3 transposase DDE domain
MGQAARTKNDLADIINVAIEELVHHRYELPIFNTLVRAAKRVRGTVDRAFYRQVTQSLNHIEELFTDVIDWKLIETHVSDMLRVVLSIKAGKFTASTILRKLGTYSCKNRLYQAFSELGRAIRCLYSNGEILVGKEI